MAELITCVIQIIICLCKTRVVMHILASTLYLLILIIWLSYIVRLSLIVPVGMRATSSIYVCICMNLHQYTVECRYNAVHHTIILHTSMQWLSLKVNETLNPQKTPHISPWRASYRVSFVLDFDDIDLVITAPHCLQMFLNAAFVRCSSIWVVSPVWIHDILSVLLWHFFDVRRLYVHLTLVYGLPLNRLYLTSDDRVFCRISASLSLGELNECNV